MFISPAHVRTHGERERAVEADCLYFCDCLK
jgi:hypothetical protein